MSKLLEICDLVELTNSIRKQTIYGIDCSISENKLKILRIYKHSISSTCTNIKEDCKISKTICNG